MTFVKYVVEDRATTTLATSLTSSATSISVTDGSVFPSTFPYELDIEKTTDNGYGVLTVTSYEAVKVTARSGNTLTVERGVSGTSGTAFDSGDRISLYVKEAIVTDIQNELTRLETDKLDKDGELRTGNGAWKVVYNNGSGNETELSLGASGTYLKSNGASSAPSFDAPPLDINGQTEDNTTLADDDYIVWYNTSEGANNKRKAKASTTNEGMVEMATDAEATAGTDETRYINPKQAKDNYELLVYAGSTTRASFSSSGTQNIAHGLSRTPKLVEFHYRLDGDGGDGARQLLYGSFDGTNNQALSIIDGGGTSDFDIDSSNCISLVTSSGDGRTATCSVDGTNISLSRTKVGEGQDLLVMIKAIA